MSRLTRLKSLELRYQPAGEMRGSSEIHCVGGWPQLGAGEECHEHERCAFRSRPIAGPLRRVVVFDWQPGIVNAFDDD
jgi:hypothetical protein